MAGGERALTAAERAKLGAAQSAPEERYDDDIEAMIAERLITRADVEAARLKAKEKIALEKKAAAAKLLADKMLAKERLAEGMTPERERQQQHMNELVDIQITLPFLKSPNSNVINYPDPIRIDQRQFHHGRSYTVTRAQAVTLLSMMGLARKHAAQVGGESPAYYDANRGAFSYMGGVATGTAGRGLASPIMERRGSAAA